MLGRNALELNGRNLAIPVAAAPRPGFSGMSLLARVLDSGGTGALAQALSSGSARNLSQAIDQLNPTERNALQARWGRSLEELISLSNERDARVFHHGLLQVGRRLEDNDQVDLAGVVYSSLVVEGSNSPHPPLNLRGGEEVVPPLRLRGGQEGLLSSDVANQAQRRLNAINGVGDWRERFAFSLQRIPNQATRWDVLLAMTGAGFTFRGFRLLTTASWAGSFESALALNAASASTAFLAETIAFTSLGKVTGALAGHPQDTSANGIFNEWAGGAAMLLGLKGMGALTGAGVRSIYGEGLAATTTGRLTQILAPQAGMFMGILVGNRLAEAGGFHPERHGDNWLVDGITTLIEFNIAGRLQRAAGGPALIGLEARMEAMTRSRASSRPSLSESLNDLMSGAAFGVDPQFITPEGIRLPSFENRKSAIENPNVFSVRHDPNAPAGSGAGLSRPNGSANGRESPFDRRTVRAFVEKAIQQTDPEYYENLDRLSSDLRPLAERDQERIDREIREYLAEGDVEAFHPQDPIVKLFNQRVFVRARPEGESSPLLESTYRDIRQAGEFLDRLEFADGRRYLPSTLRRSKGLSAIFQRPIYFFDDSSRPTGSFKERGALVEAFRAQQAGVMHLVTASHGNHGLAVALAARQLGLRSTIVVPHTTPRVKIEALENMGATVVITQAEPWRGYEESRDWGLRYTFERNAHLENLLGIRESLRYIHGFEDVIAGQGVAGLEIAEQIGQLPAELPRRFANAAFLIPMGGGGLAAGVGTVLRQRFPHAQIIGVASDQAPALHFSLLNGRRSEIFVNERGLCDSGIGLSVPGRRPFEILREVLDGSLTVSDPLVGEAMRLIHQEEGLAVEGAAATGLAALLDPRFTGFRLDSKIPMVIHLTGRNIDAARHRAVLSGDEAALPGGVLDTQK